MTKKGMMKVEGRQILTMALILNFLISLGAAAYLLSVSLWASTYVIFIAVCLMLASSYLQEDAKKIETLTIKVDRLEGEISQLAKVTP